MSKRYIYKNEEIQEVHITVMRDREGKGGIFERMFVINDSFTILFAWAKFGAIISYN